MNKADLIKKILDQKAEALNKKKIKSSKSWSRDTQLIEAEAAQAVIANGQIIHTSSETYTSKKDNALKESFIVHIAEIDNGALVCSTLKTITDIATSEESDKVYLDIIKDCKRGLYLTSLDTELPSDIIELHNVQLLNTVLDISSKETIELMELMIDDDGVLSFDLDGFHYYGYTDRGILKNIFKTQADDVSECTVKPKKLSLKELAEQALQKGGN